MAPQASIQFLNGFDPGTGMVMAPQQGLVPAHHAASMPFGLQSAPQFNAFGSNGFVPSNAYNAAAYGYPPQQPFFGQNFLDANLQFQNQHQSVINGGVTVNNITINNHTNNFMVMGPMIAGNQGPVMLNNAPGGFDQAAMMQQAQGNGMMQQQMMMQQQQQAALMQQQQAAMMQQQQMAEMQQQQALMDQFMQSAMLMMTAMMQFMMTLFGQQAQGQTPGADTGTPGAPTGDGPTGGSSTSGGCCPSSPGTSGTPNNPGTTTGTPPASGSSERDEADRRDQSGPGQPTAPATTTQPAGNNDQERIRQERAEAWDRNLQANSRVIRANSTNKANVRLAGEAAGREYDRKIEEIRRKHGPGFVEANITPEQMRKERQDAIRAAEQAKWIEITEKVRQHYIQTGNFVASPR